jgi:hypothetical protein
LPESDTKLLRAVDRGCGFAALGFIRVPSAAPFSNPSMPASDAKPLLARPPASWQFRLWHLFGLTTQAAVAAAVAGRLGLGTLVASGGIILAWLNWCGAFGWLQTSRRQAALLWLAWAMFLVSLFLPAIIVFGPVAGWQAAWIVIGTLWEFPKGIWEANVQSEAPITAKGVFLATCLIGWFVLMNLANLLAAGLPLLVWRLCRGGGRVYGALLAVAMVGPWLMSKDAHGLLVGYYVWAGSFLVALLALPIDRAAFAGMLAVALTALALAFVQ